MPWDIHSSQRLYQAATTIPTRGDGHIPGTISVAQLAHVLGVKIKDVIKVLVKLGTLVTINSILDQETAMIAVLAMDHNALVAKPRLVIVEKWA